MITLQGDFTTAFHKALATPSWISSLQRFVTARIQTSGAFRTAEGTGKVSALFTDLRYLGPNSVVRYRFEVHADVDRGEPTPLRDSYRVTVEYDPKSGGFSTWEQEEHLSTIETRARYRDELRRAKEEWKDSLEPLETREEFERWKCPVCSGKLRPRFYPEGESWSYSCAQDESHQFSDWIGVRLEPGGWWVDFVADRTCPKCRSAGAVVGNLYGLVLMEVDSEVWQLGGCAVGHENRFLWHCRTCVLDFAHGAKE